MRKGIYTALILCLIIAVIGVGLVIAGISLGGRPNFRLDWKNRTILAGDAPLQSGEAAPEACTSLELDVATADIEVRVGDAFRVEYALYDAPQITQTDGVFRLKEPEHGINVIGISGFSGQDAYVRVTVPAGAQLESVKLDSSTGVLTVSELACKTLTVDLSTGDANLIGVSADVLTADASTGSIRLTDCAVKDAQFDVSTGSIEARNLTVTESLRADASTGDVALDIRGQAADFAMELESGTGAVRVDGKDQGDDYSSSGSIPITVDTSTGDVTITFR